MPENVPLSQLSLGDARSLGGNHEGAKQAYLAAEAGLEKLRQEQPNSPFVAIGLAFTEAGLGNKEAALREGARPYRLFAPRSKRRWAKSSGRSGGLSAC